MVDPTELHDLFDRAISLPAADRLAFLDHTCGGNSALRREVERLLAADARLGAVFETGGASDLRPGLAHAPATSLPPGTRLGPYEIASLLGRGGMGEVYCARDPRLGRDVAVKVLPAAFRADPDRLRRFEREARACARLEHPHIVAVYDVGVDAGISYIVSERLDGRSLRARLADGPLETQQAVTRGHPRRGDRRPVRHLLVRCRAVRDADWTDRV